MSSPLRLWSVAALAIALAGIARANDSIACGETVTRLLSTTPVEATVDARVGEVLAITVMPTLELPAFKPVWRLIDQGNHALLLDNGDHRCTGRCATAPLPADGTYTIRVGDQGIGVGLFTLTVEAVSATAEGESNGPPSPTCFRTVNGAPDGTRPIDDEPLAGSIEPRGETDTFTLVVAPGDTVHAEVAAIEDGAPPAWEAYDASGTRLSLVGGKARCTDACDTEAVVDGGVVTVLVACESGTGGYTIEVHHAPSSTTTTTTPGTTTTSTTLVPEFTLGETVRAPMPVAPLHLGTAIVASGGRLVIGAPREDVEMPSGLVADAGAVFTVDVAGMPGSPGFGDVGRLAMAPAAGHEFGAAVANAGAGLLVGAPGEPAAYLFEDPTSGPTRRLVSPTGEPDDGFGSAVAVSGGLLAIGAPRADVAGNVDAGRVYLFGAGGSPLVLQAPVPASGARFGTAIAADAGRLLVGAPGGPGLPGTAFLFVADTGELVATFVAPGPELGDEFGAAVAFVNGDPVVGAPNHGGGTGLVVRFVSGNPDVIDPGPLTPGARFGESIVGDGQTLFVGAPGAIVGGVAAGAVYAFDAATEMLHGTSPRAGDAFGAGLAAVGGRVFIGAPGSDTGTTDGGAVQVFQGTMLLASFRERLSPAGFGSAAVVGDGTLVAGAPDADAGRGLVARVDLPDAVTTTRAPETASGADFGASVALVSGTVAVGAPREKTAEGERVGAVYLIAKGGEPVRVANPHPQAGDEFGFAVGAIASDLLASAPFDGPADTGVVYRISQGTLRVTYAKPAPSPGDFFGAAVAGDGADVVVGAPFDSAGGAARGGVYVFDADTAALQRFVPAPDDGAGLFGSAVAIGDSIVVGAPLADTSVAGSGAVYVIERATGVVRHRLERPVPTAGDQFGASVALVGDRVIVGVPLVDDHAVDTGAVYVFDAASGALVQVLRSPSQGALDRFGFAVAADASAIVVGSPGPSRVYLFDPITAAIPAATGFAARAIASVVAQCGNGLVEAGEACDDGNDVDDDDCRNDCTPGPCCTLSATSPDCDDGDVCTIDEPDPSLGCTHRPSGAPGCCASDADCPGGQCRFCVGCFVYRWDCCDQNQGGSGSTCIPSNPACEGKTCVEAAYCQCEGKLDCGAETIPDPLTAPFASACDQLRLQQSVSPDGTPATKADLVLARHRARAARKSLRATVRTARAMLKEHALSRTCRRQVVAQVKVVRHAIPRGRRLRLCVLGSG